MYIDISGPPPATLAKQKKRLLRIVLSLSGLICGGLLLGAIRVFFDTGHDAFLENAALILFVGAGFAFVYFTEKLQAFKQLTEEQRGKVRGFCQQHREIAAYCDQVTTAGRNLILAEYEAITAHVDRLKGSTDATKKPTEDSK